MERIDEFSESWRLAAMNEKKFWKKKKKFSFSIF
jgi:hypothetical protein